jgi:hypothetical protein
MPPLAKGLPTKPGLQMPALNTVPSEAPYRRTKM